MKKIEILNGTILKIIALIAMTIDHIGVFIFPDLEYLRIIGRLAFPIFSYMVAEGVKYTHNRLKYFLMIFIMGLLISIGYYCLFKEVYLTIFISFSVGILICYASDLYRKNLKINNQKALLGALLMILLFALAYFIGFPPDSAINAGYHLEYGFFGIMMIPLIYLSPNKILKLIFTAFCLLGLALTASLGVIQWYGFLSLIPLILYSGKPGKHRMKYLFYIYYPVHIAIIYLISLL